MAIKFDITADNGGFLKAAQQSEEALQNLENRAQSTGSSIKDMFEQAAAIGGISLGVAGMKQFVSKVYEVRSYFQDINSSMVAFLGNQEKANEFTNKLKDYAWYNMFEFSELAQASQQMIAYGVAVEDIIPTIDRLSNIAVATKSNLLEMVDMYDKARSVGGVNSQSIQSWATHGVVIKDVLKEMGEQATSSSISFEQLEKVIAHVTDEGGLFYGQQEKMMDNLSSSVGQLQDDMDSMFNEIGEKMQAPMKSAIEFASNLVDNYQEVAKSIGEIIVAYGVYRAALAASVSIDKTAGSIVYKAEKEAMEDMLATTEQVKKSREEELYQSGKITLASAERVTAIRNEIAAEEERYQTELKAKIARGQMTNEQAKELTLLRAQMADRQVETALNEEIQKSLLKTAEAEVEAAKQAKVLADEQVEWFQTLIERSEAAGTAAQTEAYTTQLQTAMEKQHNAALALSTAETELNTVQENLNTAAKEANIAATNRQILAEKVSIKTMGLAKAAALQLRGIIDSIGAAIDANPIGIITAAVVGLGYAVYKLSTFETEAQKKAKELQKAHAELNAEIQSEKSEMDRLFGALKGATEGTDTYNDAKKAILDKYGDYLKGLKDEVSSLKDVEAAYKAVAVAARQSARDRMIDSQMKLIQSDYEDAVLSATQEMQNALEKHFGEEKGNAYLSQIQEQIMETGKVSDELRSKLEDELRGTFAYGNFVNGLKNLEKAQTEVIQRQEKVNMMFGASTLFDNLKEEELVEQIENLEKARKEVEETGKATAKMLNSGTEEEFLDIATIDLYIKKAKDAQASRQTAAKEAEKQNKKYWEDQKKEAENWLNGLDLATKTALEKRDKSLSKEQQDQYDSYMKQYKTAVENIAKYDLSGKAGKKADELRKEEAERLALIAQQKLQLQRAEEDAENELTQARINMMNDGAAKQEAQRRLNHKKTLQNIQRQKEDAIKAAYDDSKSLFEKKEGNKNKIFTEADARKDINYLKAVHIAEDRAKSAMMDAMGQYEDVSDLVGEYQDYNMKKAALDEKYAADRMRLEEAIEEYHRKLMSESLDEDDRDIIQRNERNAKAALAQMGVTYNKDVASLSIEKLKLDPSFVEAFQDLKRVSTDTLNSLYEQLQNSKDAMSALDPENIKTIADLMNQIYEEQLDRDPFGALRTAMNNLTKAREELKQSTTEVVMAQNLYNDAVAEGDPWKIVEAEQTLNEALEDQKKKQQNVLDVELDVDKAYEKIRSEVETLSSAIAELGNAIGGTTGDILGVLSNTMDVVTGMVDGIKKVTAEGVNAISTMEKASVILSMVSMAFKFFQSLSGKDSNFALYEKSAEKQKEINDLTKSVNDYVLAVAKANAAENQWFSSSQLSTLKDSAKVATEAQKAYYKELYEAQERYQDQQKSGWGKYLVAGTVAIAGVAAALWTGGSSLAAAGAAVAGMLGTSAAVGTAALVTAAAATGAALYKGGEEIIAAVNYQANQLAAVNNLRIETQKKDNGWLGTGWGGHNQKTKDLRSWAKQEFGKDLFDEAGWVQVDLAQTILDNYADKLVGETKETLETLVELKGEYDEFRENLEEAVSSLYSPIVDAFVDDLWSWFDNGTDALYAFKDKASDVFREIVSDMMKTIILEKIVGKFQEEVADLYEQYSFGNITEEQLLRSVSKNTAALMEKYETQVPVLQNMMTEMSDIISQTTGVDISASGSSSHSGSTGVSANVTQDTMDEANGRLTSLQMQNESLIIQLVTVAVNTSLLVSQSEMAVSILDDMRTMDALRNAYLSDLVDLVSIQRKEHGMKLDSIAESLKNI